MYEKKLTGKNRIRRIKRKRQMRAVTGGGICLILCIMAIGLMINKIGHKQETNIADISETGKANVITTEETEPEVIDISNEVVKGKIPLFLQSDKRWKNKIYGDDKMEINGCGPTCLSMVVCGLSGTSKYDPYTVAQLAEANGYHVSGSGSKWTLMSEGAGLLGLTSHEVIFDKEHIKRELEAGNPIICVVGPGDFTTQGHFIILWSIDDDYNVRIKDPNSKERSKKLWELDKVMPQIRNLWSYSYETET